MADNPISDPELLRIFSTGQHPGFIRPNALRDLHYELNQKLSDAEYRRIVERWLGTVTYAE